jgi:hypothetical protein
MLSNISNIYETSDLLPIFIAVLIVDLIVIIIAKKTGLFGKQIKIWYEKLGITAVILDVFIIVIGILITKYIFNYFKLNLLNFNPLYFILIAVMVQLIHDILFYILVIVPSVKGKSDVMDIYKDYAVENGYKILIADMIMVITSCLLAMLLKSQPNHLNISILILVIYLIPYYVYDKGI